jgi:hypothetical protein
MAPSFIFVYLLRQGRQKTSLRRHLPRKGISGLHDEERNAGPPGKPVARHDGTCRSGAWRKRPWLCGVLERGVQAVMPPQVDIPSLKFSGAD